VSLKRISRQDNSAPKILCESKSKVPSCINTNTFFNPADAKIEEARSIDKRSTRTYEVEPRFAIYNPSFSEGEIELDVASEPMRNVTVIEIRRKACIDTLLSRIQPLLYFSERQRRCHR
jgi:hypothetical protein